MTLLKKALRPRWRKMPRAEQTEWLRRLLWSAEWKPESERLMLLFDDIGFDQLLEDDAPQIIAGLPMVRSKAPS